MTRSKNSFQYEVALSFAGEDRSVAKRIAASLKRRGIAVFYDRDHRAELWGKSQDEFERIYSSGSRFVVPFISQHYKQKEWCRFEFDTARQEAKRRHGEFILPIRLDETRLFGLSDDINYADLRRYDIGDVVSDLAEKVRSASGRTGPKSKGHNKGNTRSVRLLSAASRRALGLICMSPFPYEALFARCFPGIEWNKEIRRFRKAGMITGSSPLLSVQRSVRTVFERDESELNSLHHAWIAALTPLKDHPDLALALGLHYFGAHEARRGIETLVDAAETMNLGFWNRVYCSSLRVVARGRRVRGLPGKLRVRLYNALGQCLTEEGKPREALEWFKKLRRTSSALGDKWGIGQSYLNSGVAYSTLGEDRNARESLESAVRHARETHDEWLLGRSLYDLATVVVEEDVPVAIQLAEESMVYKAKVGDEFGVLRSQMLLGATRGWMGEHSEAVETFRSVERRAHAAGHPEIEAQAANNAGIACSQAKHFCRAAQHHQRARRIAEKADAIEALILAAESEANAMFSAGEYAKAEALCKEARRLHKRQGSQRDAAVALYNQGMAIRLRGDPAQARRILGHALQEAHAAKYDWLVIQCHLAKAQSYARDTDGRAAAKSLRDSIRSEVRHGRSRLTGNLWYSLASTLIDAGGSREAIEDAFSNAIRCFGRSKHAIDTRLSRLRNMRLTSQAH